MSEITRPDVTRRTILIGVAAAAPLAACSKPATVSGPPAPTSGQPLTAVAEVGCVVIAGATSTVRTAALLVTESAAP